MLKLFVRKLFYRFLSSIAVLIVVISIIFIILKLSPGDPSQKYISPKLSPEMLSKLSHSFSHDSDIFSQYISFLQNTIQGDFGISFTFREPVTSIISDYLIFTVIFALAAFTIQLLISFFLSYLAAKNPSGPLDDILNRLSMVVYSTPVFVSALLIIYLFSYLLDIFPVSGLYSDNYYEMNYFEKAFDVIYHLILPTLTLILTLIPLYFRYLRDNLKSVLSSTYVLNSRSMGESEKGILLKHVIPNSVNPVIAAAGIDLGFLFGGSLVIEVIFGLPGLGRLTVSATAASDFPLIIGTCFFAGVLMILSGLISDIIRVLMDKRLIKGLLN